MTGVNTDQDDGFLGIYKDCVGEWPRSGVSKFFFPVKGQIVSI